MQRFLELCHVRIPHRKLCSDLPSLLHPTAAVSSLASACSERSGTGHMVSDLFDAGARHRVFNPI